MSLRGVEVRTDGSVHIQNKIHTSIIFIHCPLLRNVILGDRESLGGCGHVVESTGFHLGTHMDEDCAVYECTTASLWVKYTKKEREKKQLVNLEICQIS